ncbi:uncharacterized protein LOC113333683 [Papaver somniferum]|uniref:uncharacterized protein LOC113333683 n=1 Tax=Papaver somniferum TaxID=3469 RepID=UPI000E6FE308|nr:uncharacterized protein LOC113333683 [Papaver somniferum]XP_026435893.1 uncharacterized protein LOC113333683 [Papaver somniferum]XP_026435894.1 uncharacterized protein LOC113333683 [Papaver somniferum]
MIQSISVGKKKVTFKHVDLEVFKKKHCLEFFDVKFFAPDDDLSYDMIVNYKYDEFHLLTTIGAFEAGLMLPLYKSGDSFYYDVLADREGSTDNTHCRSVVQLSGNYLRTLRECYLRSHGETTMTCYTPDLAERDMYTPANFNASFGNYVNSRNRNPWSAGLRSIHASRGEVHLLSEVSDSKLRYVPGTEGTSQQKLFPNCEKLKRDHDYEWHVTVIEVLGPWAYDWVPGPRGWRPTAASQPRDSAPARYGDFCPWRLNFDDMSFEYAIDAADEDESSDVVLPPKGYAAAKTKKKKKIGAVQSSTAPAEEADFQDEVNSPVNDENVEDEEEVTDDEERIETSPPNHEKDASNDGGTHEERVTPDIPINDTPIGSVQDQGNGDAEPQPTNPAPEFSFGKIHSAGGQMDINAAMGLAEEFSLLLTNDDWDVLGDEGEKTVGGVGTEAGGEKAAGTGDEEAAGTGGEKAVGQEGNLGGEGDETRVNEEARYEKCSAGLGDVADIGTSDGPSSEGFDRSLMQDGDEEKSDVCVEPCPSDTR